MTNYSQKTMQIKTTRTYDSEGHLLGTSVAAKVIGIGEDAGDTSRYDEGSASVAQTGEKIMKENGCEVGYLTLSDNTTLFYVDDMAVRSANRLVAAYFLSWVEDVANFCSSNNLTVKEVGHIEPSQNFEYDPGANPQMHTITPTGIESYAPIEGGKFPWKESTRRAGSATDQSSFQAMKDHFSKAGNKAMDGAIYTAYKPGDRWRSFNLK